MIPQECLNRQQALSVVRQMQKLLVAQEAAHLQGTRGLRHQLSILQSHLQRAATKRNGNPGWSPPQVTSHRASSDPWPHTNSLDKGPPALSGWGWLQAGSARLHPCLSVRRDLPAAGSAPEWTDAGPEPAGGPRGSLHLRHWLPAGGLRDTHLPAQPHVERHPTLLQK